MQVRVPSTVLDDEVEERLERWRSSAGVWAHHPRWDGEGFTFVLMPFTIRNETDEPMEAAWALDVGLIGSANRMYDASNTYCDPVIPNPLYDGGELYPGGSYQGNQCLQVPTAEVEDGSLVLAVTPMMSFDDPVFVATR